MRKIVIILIVVLVLAYMGLSLVSRDKEYAAEKAFYATTKKLNEISRNPDVVTPAMYDSIEVGLEEIIKKYKETKTVPFSYIRLAEVYIADKKYDNAILTLNNFIEAGNKNVALLARAHFLKGVSYERQGQWQSALKEFHILRDKYTDTPLGIQIPAYIADHYEREKEPEKAKVAYAEAISFYTSLEERNKGTMLGYAAATMKTEIYYKIGQYEDAGKSIEYTIMNYPSEIAITQQLPYIQEIYLKALKRPDKVIELYEYIITITENEKLKTALRGQIKRLTIK